MFETKQIQLLKTFTNQIFEIWQVKKITCDLSILENSILPPFCVFVHAIIIYFYSTTKISGEGGCP